MILVDTNVFSELIKPAPDDRVVDWLFEHRNATLLSSIVVAELDIGVRTTPGADKRKMLRGWFERLVNSHEGRVVAFDLAAARRWASFSANILIAGERAGSRAFDTLIAAQALALGVALATRNTQDFRIPELVLINPWEL